ncbi:hypothetical protein ATCC90586_010324 [Pythium insidiosum]|nr:hypothetical protein ATCC90586_010324 [Pythium insidiosum]
MATPAQEDVIERLLSWSVVDDGPPAWDAGSDEDGDDPSSEGKSNQKTAWIKDLRRDDFPVKSSHVVQFLIEEYSAWATAYLAGLLSPEELLQEQIRFTTTIAASVSRTYPQGSIYNADETAVYFDDSPGLIIAEKGTGKSTDGTKLPPLIIFKAASGGSVEASFDNYPEGAVYAVQANA